MKEWATISTRPTRQNRNGFTLLEMVLTLGLLALIFFPLIQYLGIGLVASQDADDSLRAISLATQKMEQIKNITFSLVIAEARAVVPTFPGYEREVTISEPLGNLKLATVIIYWKSSGKEVSFSLPTYAANF